MGRDKVRRRESWMSYQSYTYCERQKAYPLVYIFSHMSHRHVDEVATVR